jgi:hypothetical protein
LAKGAVKLVVAAIRYAGVWAPVADQIVLIEGPGLATELPAVYRRKTIVPGLADLADVEFVGGCPLFVFQLVTRRIGQNERHAMRSISYGQGEHVGVEEFREKCAIDVHTNPVSRRFGAQIEIRHGENYVHVHRRCGGWIRRRGPKGEHVILSQGGREQCHGRIGGYRTGFAAEFTDEVGDPRDTILNVRNLSRTTRRRPLTRGEREDGGEQQQPYTTAPTSMRRRATIEVLGGG